MPSHSIFRQNARKWLHCSPNFGFGADRGGDTLLPSEEHFSITQSAKPIHMSHIRLVGGGSVAMMPFHYFCAIFRLFFAILRKPDAAVI